MLQGLEGDPGDRGDSENMARNESFTSRWGLLFAVLGLAVGTGNIWRFPRIIAQYGGAFLIPWALFEVAASDGRLPLAGAVRDVI